MIDKFALMENVDFIFKFSKLKNCMLSSKDFVIQNANANEG